MTTLETIAINLGRIADALERRPIEVRSHKSAQPGNGWRRHDRSVDRPLATNGFNAVRVQFDDGRLETHPVTSAEIDWSNVIAYQIIS